MTRPPGLLRNPLSVQHARRLLAAVIAASAALAVAACGGRAQPHNQPWAPADALRLLTIGRSAPPLKVTVDDAFESLTRQCMAVRHWAYYPTLTLSTPLDALNFDSMPLAEDLPHYGTLAQARSTGYAIVARAAGKVSLASEQPESAYVNALPTAARQRYLTALRGPAGAYQTFQLPGGRTLGAFAGGCLGSAERSLYGSVKDYVRGFQDSFAMGNDMAARLQSSARYRAAVRAWASCMAAHGFGYQRPADAYEHFAEEFSFRRATPAMRRQERATAVQDWQCAHQVALPAAISAAQRAVIRALPPRVLAQLLRIVRIYRRAGRRAAVLVPSG